MDADSSEAWDATVAAVRQYRQALARLSVLPIGEILAETLRKPQSRDTALLVLADVWDEAKRPAVPELLELARGGPGELAWVRQVIRGLPVEVLDEELPGFVGRVIDDPEADYWDFRRAAELLEDLGREELVQRLVTAGRKSDDPDMIEFVEDYDA
ncbi:hypothetical protein [Amycolatopsis anabasis]|uniref:hypothetical protein n=1 Tax=Amycolatopsis anabasis TaxID=1840409 RepID=UPI00131EB832|nr:hypothetical protein [Amycolatopsis anabasis]